MSLNEFYKLRRDFMIIGLTGKMQAGADKFNNLLTKDDNDEVLSKLTDNFIEGYKVISDSEARKLRRVKDFFSYKDNWVKFNVLEYKNVILLFILQHNFDEDQDKFVNNICQWIIKLGDYKQFVNPRFGKDDGIGLGSANYINESLKTFLLGNIGKLSRVGLTSSKTLEKFLDDDCENNDFFFNTNYEEFAKEFFGTLDNFSIYLRHKLIHVATFCLRRFGSLGIEIIEENKPVNDIYIIARVINRLIKIHRKSTGDIAHIIIDRLKNSYEIMYFRERYSGFYLVAANRNEEERKIDISTKVSEKTKFTDVSENVNLLVKLDDIEYKVNEFKEGKFDSFDIENCIQKADYHLWHEEELNCCDLSKYEDAALKLKNNEISRISKFYVYLPFEFQCLRFLALLQQPGLITPTYIERIMQIAFNTKLNSGCISRQVGAVVTDSHFSVKGIGWNDVPMGQTPCSLRDLRDYKINPNDLPEFTNFEKGKSQVKYADGETFQQKFLRDISVENLNGNVEGRPCSFCFKSFHNSYEGKENQVHTRSLHAEENAMLQISKHGGQPLDGGNLFTTASPCELCAKKAFQLGMKNIFYIDLYPGISKEHILEGGKSEQSNPNLYQFQGAIGRGFQKLYEPFMAIKDETAIRTKITPSISEIANGQQLKKALRSQISENKKIKSHLSKIKDADLIKEIINLMKKGIEKK